MVAPDFLIREDAVEEARLARARVGRHLDVRDGHAALARVDDRLERVGELRDDGHALRGLARVGAEAARRVGHGRVGDLAHDPAAEPLEELAGRGHLRERLDVAIADADVGLAGDERGEQLRDVGAVVLVVGVGVDDEVGAVGERRVDAGDEGGRESFVAAEAHDVVDARTARHVGGAVAGAVVDDQRLDDVDAGNVAR